jgi:hypothetical protein
MNAESVGEIQPRLALWQPWDEMQPNPKVRNPEGVASPLPESQTPVATPSELRLIY